MIRLVYMLGLHKWSDKLICFNNTDAQSSGIGSTGKKWSN